MPTIVALLDWAKGNEKLLWWLFAGAVAFFLLTPIVAGWFVVRMPKDYFVGEKREPAGWLNRAPALRPFVLVFKNLFGVILILAGLVMLVAPGQGLLTIAVGVMLVDFPGKYRLQRWLVRRPAVWRAINWLRKRAGREELQRPE